MVRSTRFRRGTPVGPRLFLVDVLRIHRRPPWKIGIAPGEARLGDLICLIDDVQKAVVVRIIEDWMHIVGTAVLTRGLLPQQETHNTSNEVHGIHGDYFDLPVEAEMAYILMS